MEASTSNEIRKDSLLLCHWKASPCPSSADDSCPGKGHGDTWQTLCTGPAQVIFRPSDHIRVLNHKSLSMLMKSRPHSSWQQQQLGNKSCFHTTRTRTRTQTVELALAQCLLWRAVTSAGHQALQPLPTMESKETEGGLCC